MNKRIGISLIESISYGHKWIAGFYYIKNCLNALAQLPQKDVPDILVFIPEHFDAHQLFVDNKLPSWFKPIQVPVNKSGMHDLQKSLDYHGCDVFFPISTLPSFDFKGALLAWIPDLQHKYFPQFFSVEELQERELVINFLLKYSARVICSSNSARKDILQFYSNDKTELLPFRSILVKDPILKEDPIPILSKYGINQKYIMLSNQFWIHKNHRMVFESWKILKDQGHDFLLICTGYTEDYRNPNYFSELQTYLKENDLETNIRILGFIDRAEQIQLMRNASAVLQPSLFEGWNTTIEDARSIGKMLILSGIEVHVEQCGSSAYYFEPNKKESLVELIKQIGPILPVGFDSVAEELAKTSYTEEIKIFGRALLNLFQKSSMESSILKRDDFYQLIIHLQRNTSQAREHLNTKQEVIEKLDKECKVRLTQLNKLQVKVALKQKEVDFFRQKYKKSLLFRRILKKIPIMRFIVRKQ